MARLGLVVFVSVAAAEVAGAGSDAPVAIVLAAGKASVTNRALDAWYAARDRDALPTLVPHAGFPKIIDDPRADAPPRGELLLLGVCDLATAQRVVAALAESEITILRLELPDLRGTCPRLTTTPRTSVAALLTVKDPKGAERRARRRGEVAECAHEPAALRRTFGNGYLCRSLWGVDCATYARQAAVARPPAGETCPFLLDAPAARSLLTLRAGDLQLTVCVADLSDNSSDDAAVAYVFARFGADGIDYPATAICGQGRDYATRLGELHPFGDGACIEYRRTLTHAGRTATLSEETGLHCYTRADTPPYVIFDRVIVSEASASRHRPGRYAIVEVGQEAVLCVDAGPAGTRALRLGPHGFRPVTPLPAQCRRTRYREVVLEAPP